MFNTLHYSEIENINTDIEIFDKGTETIADVIQAFISRENIKRLSVNLDEPFISGDRCDVCGSDALTMHFDMVGIDIDGDIINYDICIHCKKGVIK